MKLFYYIVIGFIGGAFLSAQSGVNSLLKVNWVQNSILAAAISFTIGALTLIVWSAALRLKPPPLNQQYNNTKWYHWTGGFMGAYLVASSTFLVPIIGASTLVALILAGKLGSAVFLDYFGILGFKKKPITFNRVLGLALLVVGVILVSYYS